MKISCKNKHNHDNNNKSGREKTIGININPREMDEEEGHAILIRILFARGFKEYNERTTEMV